MGAARDVDRAGAEAVIAALEKQLSELEDADGDEGHVLVLGRDVDAQVHAGADAVQLFDSWVGALDRSDFERYVAPYSREILADPA